MEYVVYVKINKSNYIIEINSSAFLADITDWIEINRGYGDKFHHAQSNYFPKPIRTVSGVYRYKIIDGCPTECTETEISEQESNNQLTSVPSKLDVIEAQVTYTAMMTDTLLEV